MVASHADSHRICCFGELLIILFSFTCICIHALKCLNMDCLLDIAANVVVRMGAIFLKDESLIKVFREATY
ncbi:hypothetical protein Scep_024051 [Stephania cephalantha]|uniref:Uncharacterized protein n=1 Tax=Stephania cephalantha TaxID=152367 RepID=A0AAP0HXW7_9MAGN